MSFWQGIVDQVFTESSALETKLDSTAQEQRTQREQSDSDNKKEVAREEWAQEKSSHYTNKALDAAEKIVCKMFVVDPLRASLCATCHRHAIEHHVFETPKKLAREQTKRREAADLPPLHFTTEAALLRRVEAIEAKIGKPKASRSASSSSKSAATTIATAAAAAAAGPSSTPSLASTLAAPSFSGSTVARKQKKRRKIRSPSSSSSSSSSSSASATTSDLVAPSIPVPEKKSKRRSASTTPKTGVLKVAGSSRPRAASTDGADLAVVTRTSSLPPQMLAMLPTRSASAWSSLPAARSSSAPSSPPPSSSSSSTAVAASSTALLASAMPAATRALDLASLARPQITIDCTQDDIDAFQQLCVAQSDDPLSTFRWMLVLAQSSLEASRIDAAQRAALQPALTASADVVAGASVPDTLAPAVDGAWPSVPQSDLFEEDELDSSSPMPMFPLATARTLGAKERRQSASNALVAAEQHPLQ